MLAANCWSVSIQLWWDRVVGPFRPRQALEHVYSLHHAVSTNMYPNLERTQDLGILKLIGTSPCHIRRVTLTLVFLVSDFDSATLND